MNTMEMFTYRFDNDRIPGWISLTVLSETGCGIKVAGTETMRGFLSKIESARPLQGC